MPSNTFINKTTNGVEFRESPTRGLRWQLRAAHSAHLLPQCRDVSREARMKSAAWIETAQAICIFAKALDENQLYNIFSGLSLTCQKIRKIRFPIKEPHPNLYLKGPCSGPPATGATRPKHCSPERATLVDWRIRCSSQSWTSSAWRLEMSSGNCSGR